MMSCHGRASSPRLRPLLFSIAYRMLGSVADAEDVVQEAFLRYHRRSATARDRVAEGVPVRRRRPGCASTSCARRGCGARPTSASGCPSRCSTDDADPARAAADSRLAVDGVPARARAAVARSSARCSCCTTSSATTSTRSRRSSASARTTAGRSAVRARRHVDRARAAVRGVARASATSSPSASSPPSSRATSTGSSSCSPPTWSCTATAAAHRPSWPNADRRARQGRAAARRPGPTRSAARPARSGPTEVNGQPGAIVRDPDGGLINVFTLDIADGAVQTVRSVINPDKLQHLGPLADRALLTARSALRRGRPATRAPRPATTQPVRRVEPRGRARARGRGTVASCSAGAARRRRERRCQRADHLHVGAHVGDSCGCDLVDRLDRHVHESRRATSARDRSRVGERERLPGPHRRAALRPGPCIIAAMPTVVSHGLCLRARPRPRPRTARRAAGHGGTSASARSGSSTSIRPMRNTTTSTRGVGKRDVAGVDLRRLDVGPSASRRSRSSVTMPSAACRWRSPSRPRGPTSASRRGECARARAELEHPLARRAGRSPASRARRSARAFDRLDPGRGAGPTPPPPCSSRASACPVSSHVHTPIQFDCVEYSEGVSELTNAVKRPVTTPRAARSRPARPGARSCAPRTTCSSRRGTAARRSPTSPARPACRPRRSTRRSRTRRRCCTGSGT